MALFDRKMQVVIIKPSPLDKPPIVTDKSAICLSCSLESCPSECGYVPSDGPFFPPPPSPVTSDHNYHMPFYFILMLCVLGAFFGFILYMVMVRRYMSNSRNRRNVPQVNENREDFIDENVGPVLDHPIWYIRTVGLPQDIIDSIAVFRYKKDESLIEGTDCSVCLTEFEEDESLRLLPKCSHAFHVPCIDTWLRSHKNCPLCRAPIVSNMDIPQMNNVEVSIINIVESSPNDEVNQVENARHDDDQLENLELVEEGNHEMRRGVDNIDDALPNEEGRTMDLLMKIPHLLDEKKKGVRVFSDLAEHRGKVNKELQPARRSISMDCSAAQVIHLAMNEMDLGKSSEGCGSSSDNQLAEGTKGSLDITMSKRENRNSSLYKAMKSSSFGRSLQKVPVCMKRSFSTSGKFSLPTTSRIQDVRQTL